VYKTTVGVFKAYFDVQNFPSNHSATVTTLLCSIISIHDSWYVQLFSIITQEGAGNMCFFIEKYITSDNSKLEFLDPWYCVKVIVRTTLLIINCNSS